MSENTIMYWGNEILETIVRTWHAAWRYTAEWRSTDQAQLVLHANRFMK